VKACDKKTCGRWRWGLGTKFSGGQLRSMALHVVRMPEAYGLSALERGSLGYSGFIGLASTRFTTPEIAQRHAAEGQDNTSLGLQNVY